LHKQEREGDPRGEEAEEKVPPTIASGLGGVGCRSGERGEGSAYTRERAGTAQSSLPSSFPLSPLSPRQAPKAVEREIEMSIPRRPGSIIQYSARGLKTPHSARNGVGGGGGERGGTLSGARGGGCEGCPKKDVPESLALCCGKTATSGGASGGGGGGGGVSSSSALDAPHTARATCVHQTASSASGGGRSASGESGAQRRMSEDVGEGGSDGHVGRRFTLGWAGGLRVPLREKKGEARSDREMNTLLSQSSLPRDIGTEVMITRVDRGQREGQNGVDGVGGERGLSGDEKDSEPCMQESSQQLEVAISQMAVVFDI